MNDGTRVLAGAATGALIGGVVLYLVLTHHGRHLRTRVSPTLDDASEVLREFRRALRKAQHVAREARDAAEDVKAVMEGTELSADV